MPRAIPDALDRRRESPPSGLGIGLADGRKVDPDSTNADPIHLGECRIGRAIVNNRHAARVRGELAYRVERAGVIGPVDAGLNDDDAADVEGAMELAHFVDGRGLRRIGPPGSEREARRIAKDVRVAVAGPRWDLEVHAC